MSLRAYSGDMNVADKMLYYSGLVAIALGVALIILGAMGMMSSIGVAVARGSIAIVIGIVLFGRGLRAKHKPRDQG